MKNSTICCLLFYLSLLACSKALDSADSTKFLEEVRNNPAAASSQALIQRSTTALLKNPFSEKRVVTRNISDSVINFAKNLAEKIKKIVHQAVRKHLMSDKDIKRVEEIFRLLGTAAKNITIANNEMDKLLLNYRKKSRKFRATIPAEDDTKLEPSTLSTFVKLKKIAKTIKLLRLKLQKLFNYEVLLKGRKSKRALPVPYETISVNKKAIQLLAKAATKLISILDKDDLSTLLEFHQSEKHKTKRQSIVAILEKSFNAMDQLLLRKDFRDLVTITIINVKSKIRLMSQGYIPPYSYFAILTEVESLMDSAGKTLKKIIDKASKEKPAGALAANDPTSIKTTTSLIKLLHISETIEAAKAKLSSLFGKRKRGLKVPSAEVVANADVKRLLKKTVAKLQRVLKSHPRNSVALSALQMALNRPQLTLDSLLL